MLKTIRSCASALVLSTVLAGPLAAQSAAGSYLAGRSAAVNSDYTQAAQYYTRALARDTQNVELMESAALAYLSLGRVERALPLARQMEAQGQNSQVAHMVITATLAKDANYTELLARKSGTAGIGPLVDSLVKGWAQMGAGNTDAAMAEFDKLGKEPGLEGFVMYHKALAYASVGAFAEAEAIFASDADYDQQLPRRTGAGTQHAAREIRKRAGGDL